MQDTVKFDKGNIKMIAHRGLSGIETENTALSFVAAGNRSYFGIETDVHATSDGKLVIIHDDSTARISNENLNVEKTPLNVLQNIKLKDREDGAERNDIRLIELDDYIKICKRYGKVSVLEIKNPFEKARFIDVVDTINKRDYMKNVIFISFYIENLLTLRTLTPKDTKFQFLCGELPDETINLLIANNIGVDIHYPTLLSHPEYMKKFKEGGLSVNAWTCDNIGDAEKLKALGVDFITSNILE